MCVLGLTVNPCWKPPQPQLVMLSGGPPPAPGARPLPCNQRNDPLCLRLFWQSSGWRGPPLELTVRARVCVRVCVRSDSTTTQLQANGTHKNQTGQAEGRSKHTRSPIARMTLIVAMETTLVVCLCPCRVFFSVPGADSPALLHAFCTALLMIL